MIKIVEIIDFESVNTLLEGFNRSTGFVTAILDLEGNVLSKSGWRQICTEFHRVNPETTEKCKHSDTVLASKMKKGENYHFYKCLNGLVDVAVPVVIKGEHIANLFSGQFFFEEPDINYFKEQAKKFGFDEKKYLDALKKVPVVTIEKVKISMDFLLNLTYLISELTYQKLEQSELNKSIVESEKKLREVQEMAHLGFWNWDVKTGDVEWSDEVFKIFGLSKTEFIPKIDSILALSPWAEDHQRGKELIRRAIETHDPGSYEQRFLRPDKSIGHYYSKFQGVYDVDGDLVSIFGTILDTTERAQTQEKISQMNAELEMKVIQRTSQLEASNKELEAFSYSVSHDLRAPLRHINGYVDLLNERFHDVLPDKAQHYLAIITDASKQMGTLIDELLQFSRTGRQELHPIIVDMNGMIKEILEILSVDIEKRDIKWSIDELPNVFGDYTMLKQVWANLLDNAVKYTQKKKEVDISIGFTDKEEQYIFYVRDNGVGFNMKYAKKLFGVFQRLHSQTEFKGTGIGLAIVQRIVHKHRGRVWAEAKPEIGATFFFSLPKNKQV